MENFNRFVHLINKEIPLRIKYKNESWEMKYLSILIQWFNPTFMTDFTTVIGYTVYFTSREYVAQHPQQALQTLVHEAVHLLDTKRLGFPVFAFGYLFPQILALGVFFCPFSYYFLLFLIFLLPFPAPFRAYFEARAYTADLLLHRRGVAHVVSFFSNWDYYKMYPFERAVKRRLEAYSQNPDATIRSVLAMYQQAMKK